MARRILIASAATVGGVVAAIIFSEVTRSHSNTGANIFFGLGLGAPVVYFFASLARRRWSETGVAVGMGVVSFMSLMIYVMRVFGRGMEGL